LSINVYKMNNQMSPLQKGHVTAAALRSQRKMPEQVAPMRAHIFETLCAPSVSRACHRSGAAFAEEDARASRSNALCFAAHISEVLCAPGVPAVRFCSEINVHPAQEPL
jgi:hypothetical protein